MNRRMLILPLLVFLFGTGFAQKTDLKALEKNIDQAFETFAPTGMAVAIVQGDKVIYKNAWGKKDAGSSEKLSTQSLFNIASCSKAFTAASLAMVIDDGKAEWEDKLIQHVPEFQLADRWITQEINLIDILCHRSGLGTFYGDLLWYGTEYSHADIISRMRHLPITNNFRTDYGYQNNMYMLAGEVVTRNTGLSWSDFVDQRIFTPLDMKNSRPSNDELDPGQNIAWPHIEGKKVELYDFESDKAAGAIFSNVEELSNWARMLLNDGKWNGKQILDPATIQFLFKAQTLQNLPPAWKEWGIHFRSYALGWGLFDYGGKMVVEHNGGMPGYISKVSLIPEEDIAVIVLNNGMDFFVNDVVRFYVYDAFLNKEAKDWTAQYKQSKDGYLEWKAGQGEARKNDRKMNTQPSLALDAYEGDFEDKIYGKAKVFMKNGALYLDLLPGKFFKGSLSHWHYDTFKVQFNDPFLDFGLITFEKNSRGEAVGFKIDLPSDDFHFEILDFQRISNGEW